MSEVVKFINTGACKFEAQQDMPNQQQKGEETIDNHSTSLVEDASQSKILACPLPGNLSNHGRYVMHNLGRQYYREIRRALRAFLDHRATRLPGTIYGMSILHRSPLSAPIQMIRLRRRRYKRQLEFLYYQFSDTESKYLGAPETPWDYLHVLSACKGSHRQAAKLVEELWDPQVTEECKEETIEYFVKQLEQEQINPTGWRGSSEEFRMAEDIFNKRQLSTATGNDGHVKELQLEPSG
ncbi:hypothetical protein F4819DRAFT_237801 [Hypoxylon fuscum]|nr:hypothetical protein F4819DRAFT_237801 [Hypoxylon fuscum]